MNTAATLSEPTQRPDPRGDQGGCDIPHRFVRILAVLRALLGFGQRRIARLEQSGELTAEITRAFGMADWDKIWWDVTWGLLLLEALTDWVWQRVMKLRDGEDDAELEPGLPPPAKRKPRSKAASTQASEMPDNAAHPDDVQAEDDRFRTVDDIIAWMRVDAEWAVRQDPIGVTIADICRCLGVLPADLGAALWRDVRTVIATEGGSLSGLRDHMTERWCNVEGTVPPDLVACFASDPPATGPPFH
jgi:hypothetical protein